uniref:Uncharacterized protein n=1 Tax=Lepeophtheirus salmonis TaxID=72036 RepID=A0A0K2TTS0_LEPSM
MVYKKLSQWRHLNLQIWIDCYNNFIIPLVLYKASALPSLADMESKRKESGLYVFCINLKFPSQKIEERSS